MLYWELDPDKLGIQGRVFVNIYVWEVCPVCILKEMKLYPFPQILFVKYLSILLFSLQTLQTYHNELLVKARQSR